MKTDVEAWLKPAPVAVLHYLPKIRKSPLTTKVLEALQAGFFALFLTD
jgi:hypothetical protein